MNKTIKISGRSENLHFIRFFAAIGVMICHCFSIAEGRIDREWLYRLTGGQLNFGLLSVAIFFLAAGFFISRSVEKPQSAGAFFTARAIRIFPPLIFVCVTVILAGSLFSELSAREYFTSAQTWKYMLNSVFIPVHNLPGVFLDNPYLPTVNGSLWTLPIEFACYIACYLMYKWKMTTQKGYALTIPLACVGFIVTRLIGQRLPMVENLLIPCFFFYIGIGYWVYHDRIVLKRSYSAASFILIVIGCLIGQGKAALLLGLPYILFSLSFADRQVPKGAGNLGDYSYGMYLWGFPVQQAVQSCMKEAGTPVRNLLFAVPLTILLGMMTYFVVEKQINRVQKKTT